MRFKHVGEECLRLPGDWSSRLDRKWYPGSRLAIETNEWARMRFKHVGEECLRLPGEWSPRLDRKWYPGSRVAIKTNVLDCSSELDFGPEMVLVRSKISHDIPRHSKKRMDPK